MIATYAFRASSIEMLKQKIINLKSKHPDVTTIQYQAYHNDNLGFSSYDEEKLFTKLETRGGLKFLKESGHFTVTFTEGMVSIHDYATSRVQWEQ